MTNVKSNNLGPFLFLTPQKTETVRTLSRVSRVVVRRGLDLGSNCIAV